MRTAAAVLLALILVSPVLALQRPRDEPLAFVPVAVPAVSGEDARVGLRRDVASDAGASPSAGSVAAPHRSGSGPNTREVIPVPSPHLIVVSTAGDGPQPHRLAGPASWYCGHGSTCTRGYPGGLYAAAGPSLRVGDWRHRDVLVRVGTQSLRVELIDWCACPHGRLLDLYSDAFQRLAPLSRGTVKVSVSW